MFYKHLRYNLLCICLCFCSSSFAIYASMPQASDIIGQTQTYATTWNDTVESLARKYNVGVYEMIEANPRLEHNRIKSGMVLTIPTQIILPAVEERHGIVINLAEMRLYYFNPLLQTMITEPIGIGRQGWTTPIASTQIIAKHEQPTWNVPESIRVQALTQGLMLPEQVPPGPDNPLGEYALRLGIPGYLIHGTNNPGGVGRRSSAGCIRMFPEGIGLLFSAVGVGTPVRIIDEPYKLGWQDGELFLEVHKPLQEAAENNSDNLDHLVQRIKSMAYGRPIFVNWAVVFETLKRQQGIPVKIGFDQRKVTVSIKV